MSMLTSRGRWWSGAYLYLYLVLYLYLYLVPCLCCSHLQTDESNTMVKQVHICAKERRETHRVTNPSTHAHARATPSAQN